MPERGPLRATYRGARTSLGGLGVRGPGSTLAAACGRRRSGGEVASREHCGVPQECTACSRCSHLGEHLNRRQGRVEQRGVQLAPRQLVCEPRRSARGLRGGGSAKEQLEHGKAVGLRLAEQRLHVLEDAVSACARARRLQPGCPCAAANAAALLRRRAGARRLRRSRAVVGPERHHESVIGGLVRHKLHTFRLGQVQRVAEHGCARLHSALEAPQPRYADQCLRRRSRGVERGDG